jgi:putative MATE family efflux protein
MYLGLNAVLRSSGYPKMAMSTTLLSVVVNCALNPVFIFWMDWGIKGAAWATIISQVISLLLQVIHFSNPKQLLHFRKSIFKLRKDLVKGILSIGMSPFLMNVCAFLVVTLINRGLKDNGGDMAIGAYGIVNRISALFVMVIMGLTQGMQPIVGYNYGARKLNRVVEVTKLTIWYSFGIATFGFLVCQLFPETIVRIFTSEQELISPSVYGLHIIFALFPIVSFQIVATNFFQSLGMAKKAIFLSLTRQLIFLVPCLIILPPIMGALGVWISIPIADVASTILTAILFFSQLKKFKQMASEPTFVPNNT